MVMATTEDPDQKLADTEGRPTPGVDLIVVALDGRRPAPVRRGRSASRGPRSSRGTWTRPSMPRRSTTTGYFRSGDLGVVDAEGYVTITGRLKDVIIRHGENISAKEVEDLLYEHPAVADVAVIGLPDPKTGERACAVVAVAEGQTFDFATMGEYLRGRGTAGQRRSRAARAGRRRPRNPAGKILKHTLRERFAPARPRPARHRTTRRNS